MKKSFNILFVTVAVLVVVGFVYYTRQAVPDVPNTVMEILRVRAEGGLCIYGQCGSETVFYTTGRYTYKEGQRDEVEGKISMEDITTLGRLINAADFAVIKSRPFTDTCPIAYDGQEFIYTFSEKNEMISSCKVVVDQEDPLFAHIHNLLAQVHAQAAPEEPAFR